MELLDQSHKLQSEAAELIQASEIVKVLEKYGDLEFVGSYATNLMLDPDIDIHVINSNISKQIVLVALNELIKMEFFKSYQFSDTIQFPDERFPSAYYIGLKLPYYNKKWKFDIWFATPENNRIKETITLSKKLIDLPSQQRSFILQLKEYRNTQHLPISSFAIYTGVLNRTIKSIEDIL